MLYCITFIFLLHNVFPTYSKLPVNKMALKSCKYGETVENACNKCVCTMQGVYHCTASCETQVTEIFSNKPETCQPNTVYILGFTSCICTTESVWPHKACYDAFGLLPTKLAKKPTCLAPQEYVKVDCNVCRCTNGQIDPSRCTHNDCGEKKPRSRKNTEESKDLFGQCAVKNWYSLAPCQFCYCVETNKLMCSTSVSHPSRYGQMNLGASPLILCGAGLLREIAAMVPSLKLRSFLSDEDDASNGVNVNNGQDTVMTKEYLQEVQKKIDRIKALTEKQSRVDELPNTYYDESARSGVRENKLHSDEIPLDVDLDNTRRRYRKQNGGPALRFNYDPRDAAMGRLRFRRSLRIVKTGECKLGSVITHKCNLCHCLKNGKMLCTNKKCK
ncbi:uncharacterized protein LOC125238042 [Leguminivora glycinivorella]|uniref:uncharacterized protein LOC125238042 n=1 Tax=Leguminivora glycinivorella TaxID=1035111 RepID=UPI00200EC820|nr:uncharacterized protein LOC125238042 [Leguminivora glycinivorella]